MNLYANHKTPSGEVVTLEFEVTLHEDAATMVWYVKQVWDGEAMHDFFVETWQQPDEKYLVDKILEEYKNQIEIDHSRKVRHELDLGVI